MELFLCYFFVKWKLPVIVCSLESLLLKNLWKFRIRHRHLNLLYRRIFWVVRAFSTTLMTLSFIYVFKVRKREIISLFAEHDQRQTITEGSERDWSLIDTPLPFPQRYTWTQTTSSAQGKKSEWLPWLARRFCWLSGCLFQDL